MNKYLEKIAEDWVDLEEGVKATTSPNKQYIGYQLTPEAKERINSKLDKRHRDMGSKVFGGLGGISGGLLGAALGPKSIVRGNPGIKPALSRGLKGAAIGGLVGAGVGALLAHGGNKQVHDNDGGSYRRSEYLKSITTREHLKKLGVV